MTNKQIQTALKYLNYYKGCIDGKIGIQSLAAISAYEKAHGSINNLPDYIMYIQRRLNFAGNYHLTVDGLVGSGTRAATKKFQKANGLSADGVCGVKTQAKINRLKCLMPPEKWKCKCGGKYCGGYPAELSQKLYDIIMGAVAHFGKTEADLVVTSGFRCTKYNRSIGSSDTSRHVYGHATDFRIVGVSASELKSYVYTQGASYAYVLSSTYGTIHCQYNYNN